MSGTRAYREAWEGYWAEAPAEQGYAFWDAEPALTAEPHLALLAPHLGTPDLPFVDVGCGNGTQTRYLAGRCAQVVGCDLSAAAIALARRADPGGLADYRQLDAADPAETGRLHAELGDAHVYLRGVLHQAEAADRQALADGVATLLGVRGRAFIIEPAQAAGELLRSLAQGPSGPPPKMLPVLRHGIAPVAAPDASIPELLRAAGLSVLAAGRLPLATSDHLPDGMRIELPSHWFVVGRSA